MTDAGASEGADVLAARYDTALVDLDGVVYVGPRAVPGAPAALAAARDRGMRVAFVTNNASRTPEAVATHLRELGVQAEARDVVTSAQAAATLLADRLPAGAAVLVVGGEGLHAALAERGLRGVRSAEDQPQAVVQGFAPEVDWRQLAEGALAVSRGLLWVASNVDLTIPTDRGIAPGNGTLVAAVAAATGASPLVAGKPELPLHREAVRRTGARRALVVGDRLDTDIEGANRAGVDSLLVLTGVTSPAELVTAPPALRPTYVAADLCRGLLQPLPTVRRADGTWSCGGWALSDDGAGTAARGAGDRVDGLRALCALAWERGAPADVEAVLGALGW